MHVNQSTQPGSRGPSVWHSVGGLRRPALKKMVTVTSLWGWEVSYANVILGTPSYKLIV